MSTAAGPRLGSHSTGPAAHDSGCLKCKSVFAHPAIFDRQTSWHLSCRRAAGCIERQIKMLGQVPIVLAMQSCMSSNPALPLPPQHSGKDSVSAGAAWPGVPGERRAREGVGPPAQEADGAVHHRRWHAKDITAALVRRVYTALAMYHGTKNHIEVMHLFVIAHSELFAVWRAKPAVDVDLRHNYYWQLGRA